MKITLATIILLLLYGCYSSRKGIELSKFEYDSRFYNSLIFDRVPEYGDGKKDGCVVMEEVYLSLEPSDSSLIFGSVKDVETLEPLEGAIITLFLNKIDSSFRLTADSNGNFRFIRSDLKKMEVEYIGYRTLIVNLSRKDFL